MQGLTRAYSGDGRDSRGRKQYVYHPNWREIRNGHKFDHILDFAKVLPSIREHVAKDSRRRKTDRQKVLATVVRLLDTTLIRVGNADYAAQNKSYGLTTLRDRHAVINGTALEFQVTKSGKSWRLKLRDRRITRAVKDCRTFPANTFSSISMTPASEERSVIGRERVPAGNKRWVHHSQRVRTWAERFLRRPNSPNTGRSAAGPRQLES